MAKYDKDYRTENLFGKPYKGLISFFKKYPKKGTVLDLGCGQGRDSLSLAKIGYQVTGVDISEVGVNQMLKSAKKEGLTINGLVEDIYEFKIDDSYDIILLDSMFHFEKRDKEKETKFLQKILKNMKQQGILCIFVWKSKRIEAALLDVFKGSKEKWQICEDKYIKYPEQNMQYRMYIVKKIA